MYKMYVENSKGDILQLTNNSDFEFWHNGLNSQSAAINSTKSALMDGSKKNSASLNEKSFIFYMKIRPPVEINRNKLYRFFNAKGDIRIFYKNSTVDVYIDGSVETFDCETVTENEIAIATIFCNDPHFKAAADTVYSFANIESLFEFPFAIPAAGIPFSEVKRLTSKIVNHGDIESGVVIEFFATTAQILNPAFYNRTTQKYIKVLFDMEQGDLIRVNTNRNQKSITLIREGVETNILNDMESGSEWVTLEAGENEISYDADEGGDNLNVTVTTLNKYLGV